MVSSSQAPTSDLQSPNRFQVRSYPTTLSITLPRQVGWIPYLQQSVGLDTAPTCRLFLRRVQFGMYMTGAAVILQLPQMPSLDLGRWMIGVGCRVASTLGHRESTRRGGRDLRYHSPSRCFLFGSPRGLGRKGRVLFWSRIFASIRAQSQVAHKAQTASDQAIKRPKQSTCFVLTAHPSPTYSAVTLPPHSMLPPLTSPLPSYFRSPDNVSAVNISHRS